MAERDSTGYSSGTAFYLCSPWYALWLDGEDTAASCCNQQAFLLPFACIPWSLDSSQLLGDGFARCALHLLKKARKKVAGGQREENERGSGIWQEASRVGGLEDVVQPGHLVLEGIYYDGEREGEDSILARAGYCGGSEVKGG